MTLSRDDVTTLFSRPVAVDGNRLLREPQQRGYAAAVDYFANGGDRAVEQIPVGCGKSGLITLLPFGCATGRVLVVAPNVRIRDQLVAAFTPGHPRCFYTTSAALLDLTGGPHVAALDASANLSDLNECHVAVTNIQQLVGGGRWLGGLPNDFFDLIIVDEGHHNAAPTWQGVFKTFPNAKVISLTATPFRADEQPVEGDPIYRYPIAEAMRQGYIKNIQSSNVAPSELLFSYRGDEKLHTLEEVLKLKERDWFSRGVALSEACNVSIVDASIEWLRHLRQTGTRHQIVAAACSVVHARSIRRLYEERGYQAREIYSEMRADQKSEILRDLENGTIDVIVQVQMLGEGFDHPPLSVAAVFRPYRSLNPYIQFVGRVMRVNHQNAPGHPDNRGIIVSHVGLNLDHHWDDFKTIDIEDRALVNAWLLSQQNPPPSADPSRRTPLQPNLRVTDEQILDHFLGDAFLDIDTADMPNRVLDVLRAAGIDPSAAGLGPETLEALAETSRPSEPTGPVQQPVGPQARRIAQQASLNDKTKAVAVRICHATGLSVAGRRIASKSGARNDLAAVIVMVNKGINEHLGMPVGSRPDLDLAQLAEAHANLEAIGDQVQAEITKKIA